MKKVSRVWRLSFLLWTLSIVSQSLGQNTKPIDRPRMGQGPSSSLPQMVNAQSGAFNFAIPIEVPPARGGIQPDLALRYSSSKKNGWCGMGWDIETSYIQRDTSRVGVPIDYSHPNAYTDSKGFVFCINGLAGRLVKIAGGSIEEYRSEIERAFLKFYFDRQNNRWTVVDKGGNAFILGETGNSRQWNSKWGDANSANVTFEWRLSKVEDVDGNTAVYHYTRGGDRGLQGTQLYVDTISYNSFVDHANNYACQVKFNLESSDRSDKIINFRPGFRQQTNKRLASIQVCTSDINGNLTQVRKYGLAYLYSESTKRSLLHSITVFGNDVSPTNPDGSSESPYVFTYNTMTPNGTSEFDASNNYWDVDPSLPRGIGGYSGGTAFGGLNVNWENLGLIDINGDGLPDRVISQLDLFNGGWKVQINNGHGFNSATTWGPLKFSPYNADFFDGSKIAGTPRSEDVLDRPGTWEHQAGSHLFLCRTDFIDMNGDGLPDRLVSNGSWMVQLNRGTSPEQILSTMTGIQRFYSFDNYELYLRHIWSTDFYQAPLNLTHTWTEIADMNGDGLPDRLVGSESQIDSQNSWRVQLNNGRNGFDPAFPWINSHGQISFRLIALLGGFSQTDSHKDLIDLNGDGLPDLFQDGQVRFNNGISFEDAEQWVNSDSVAGSSTQTGGQNVTIQQLVDINGDGLPDQVHSEPSGPFHVQINNGAGFDSSVQLWGPTANASSFNPIRSEVDGVRKLDFIDLNGDGLPDRVMTTDTTMSVLTFIPNYGFYYIDVPTLDSKWLVHTNKAPFPDLLRQITSPLGGKTAVSYIASTSLDNADTKGNQMLRGITYVVSKIVCDPMIGGIGPSTTSYSYSGGFFDPITKEFAGFHKVVQIDPGGVITKTYFHQSGGIDGSALGEFLDQGSKGKRGIPYRIETCDSGNALHRLVLNKVEEVQLYPANSHTIGSFGVVFPKIVQSIIFEGEPININQKKYRAKAVQYEFNNATGNVISETQYGEVEAVRLSDHSFKDVNKDDTVRLHTRFSIFTGETDDLKIANIRNRPSTNWVETVAHDSVPAKLLRYTILDYTGTFGDRGKPSTVYSFLDDNENGTMDAGELKTQASFEYDRFGNMILQRSDPTLIIDTTSYDSDTATFPVSSITTRQGYDGSFSSFATFDVGTGLRTSKTDINGLITTNIYDSFFRLKETRLGRSPNVVPVASDWIQRRGYHNGGITSGVSANYLYERTLDPNETANGTGFESYSYFDGLGRLIQKREESEVSGKYRVQITRYNGSGQINFQSDPILETGSGFTKPNGYYSGVAQGFDKMGRASQLIPDARFKFSQGSFQSWAPTKGDNIVSPQNRSLIAYSDGWNPWARITTDGQGIHTKSSYDAFGRLKSVLEGDGTSTLTYDYDVFGNLATITGAAGKKIELFYDNLGRKRRINDPDAGETTFEYDLVGRVTQTRDAKQQLAKFYYDDRVGRISKRETYRRDGDTDVLATTTTFTYDSSPDASFAVYPGQLYKTESQDVIEKYGYDLFGNTIKSSRQFSYTPEGGEPVTVNSEMGQQFDAIGRLVGLTYPADSIYGKKLELAYDYDNAGHQIRIRTAAGQQWPIGTAFTHTFYQASSFTDFDDLKQCTLGAVLTRTMEYHPNSKRLKNQTVKLSGARSSLVQQFSYFYRKDDILTGTLDSVHIGGMSDLNPRLSSAVSFIAYDGLHSMTKAVTSGNGTFNYSFNQNGGLASSDEDDRVSAAASIYSYDNVEHPNEVTEIQSPTRGTITFDYDLNGNMIHNGSRTLIYDEQDQLVQVDDAQGGVTTYYRYSPSGDRIYKRITSVSGSEIITTFVGDFYDKASDGTEYWHIYAGGLLATVVPSSGQIYYYLNDHLGSPKLIVDKTGQTVQEYGFTPYGVTSGTGGGLFDAPFKFSGQRWDESSGLYYCKARYYDPSSGLFTQPDPLISNAHSSRSLNPYLYVEGDPLNRVDPTGCQSNDSFLDATLTSGSGSSIGSSYMDELFGSGASDGWNVNISGSSDFGNVFNYFGGGGLYTSFPHAGDRVFDVPAYERPITVGFADFFDQVKAYNLTGGRTPEPSFLANDPDVYTRLLERGAQCGAELAVSIALSEFVPSGGSMVEGPWWGPGIVRPIDRMMTIFHGTTKSATGKLLNGGFRANVDAVFFAEDYATANYFGLDRVAETGARSGYVLRYNLPQSLARELGLNVRSYIGEFRGLRPVDIPSGSGFERILMPGKINAFNKGVQSGQITVKPLSLSTQGF
jgi:RHS repeat-associated protein